MLFAKMTSNLSKLNSIIGSEMNPAFRGSSDKGSRPLKMTDKKVEEFGEGGVRWRMGVMGKRVMGKRVVEDEGGVDEGGVDCKMHGR